MKDDKSPQLTTRFPVNSANQLFQDAEPQVAPAAFPMRVQVLLAVDGEPKARLTLELGAVTPPKPGEGVEVSVPLDARQLAALLEPLVGPGNHSDVGVSQVKIWRPQ